MKKDIEKANFVKLTKNIIFWYHQNKRNLPWRMTRDPYRIWISEIILQQTRVEQGKDYYNRFIQRFPTVKSLSQADIDDVLLYWKGLGYYSRAINIHIAAHQIMDEYHGTLPKSFKELQKLKGIGKYTAAAIASICYDEAVPAIDGNFFRFFSRVFADDFDISSTKAYSYFFELTLPYVDQEKPGDFNQAIMDIGSSICKPKNPNCIICPAKEDCLAFQFQIQNEFPVKTKKITQQEINLFYFFIKYKDQFLIKQRDNSSIWKKLYEFPTILPQQCEELITKTINVRHKLTHKILNISFQKVEIKEKADFQKLIQEENYTEVDYQQSLQKSFPKPLQDIIDRWR